MLFYDTLLRSSSYKEAKQKYLDVLRSSVKEIREPKPSSSELKSRYQTMLDEVKASRGRELFFPTIGSGAGNGPFIELCDGSVKYDLITGIGVNFFGHGNVDLFEAQIDGVWSTTMQGNLTPNKEYLDLMKALLASVGSKSKLENVWLTSCGATANEIALKIIRQKKAPASKVMAFKNCFAGRTTALQEITDNPKYREGQPVYDEVFYLPFFDPHSAISADDQAHLVIAEMRKEVERNVGRYCCLEFEIIQGEGGFNFAPKAFLRPICEEAKKLGMAIWVDEIQTFGRTGEVFAFQKIEIDDLVDVVTVAKLLQTGAVLWTKEYNPKPGLVSGTFAGSTASLRAGKYGLDLLQKKLTGPNGRISDLEKQTNKYFQKIKEGPAGVHLKDFTVVGGMIAFTLFDGSLEKTKKFLSQWFQNGVIAFFCGHGPYRVRMLPPFAVITDEQWKDVFERLEKTIIEVA
ncbi:MAG: aminotransferase class III-fold pyridoxal phosphate-dependent enzyme [Bacteriovoracia bacterium]